MRLGEVLVDLGFATTLQVDTALSLQRQLGGYVGAILIAIGAITGDQLQAALKFQRESAGAEPGTAPSPA
jgi:hypothetical protein